MKKAAANNTFTGGLVQDLNPLNNLSLMNDVLTNCLNGTLITYNGNEYVLQNDMGNGRVETATLPSGFIPLGTAELGGIIYIVSYNPLTNLSLIGSFPSPERNITTDELGESIKTLSWENLFEKTGDRVYIKGPKYKLSLLDKELNPGDKFLIFSPKLEGLMKSVEDYSNIISAWNLSEQQINKDPRYLKLHVVSVDKEGKITYLDNNVVWTEVDLDLKYYIRTDDVSKDNSGKISLEEYRELVNSNYNVFTSKSKGTLAILAELECIDTFDVGWDANITDIENGNKKAELFLTLNWTYQNPDEESRHKINLNKLLISWNSDEWSDKLSDEWFDENPKEIKFAYPGTGTTDILYYEINKDNPKHPEFYNVINEVGDEVTISTAPIEEKDRVLRKNDGSDNDLIIGLKDIKYSPSSNELQELSFEVIPGMPFGYMKYLSKNIKINLNKLGTGATDIIEWRYYVNKDNVVINWGLDCYPEKNKKINSVRFDFYALTNEMSDISEEIDRKEYYANIENLEEEWLLQVKEDSSFYTDINNKSSYSGHFTEVIELDLDKKNKCYLTKITIDYSGEKRYYFRILYTTPIFNLKYLEAVSSDEINNDFKNIPLSEVLEILPTAINTNTLWKDHTISGYLDNGKEISINKVFYSEEEKREFINAVQQDVATLDYNAQIDLKTNNTLDSNVEADARLFQFDYTLDSTSYDVDSEYDTQALYYGTYDTLPQIDVNPSTVRDNVVLKDHSIHISQEFTIDTPFKLIFDQNTTKQINYKLVNITKNKGILTFYGSKNEFYGTNNSFPNTGDKNNILINMSESVRALSLLTNSDITTHTWSVNKVSDSLNGDGKNRIALNLYSANSQGRKVVSSETFNPLDIANSNAPLIVTYSIRTISGDNFCILSGLTTQYLAQFFLDSQGSNQVDIFDYLYKWISTLDIQEGFILSNLVYYKPYTLSLKLTTTKDIEINKYYIADCEFSLGSEVLPPKNLLLRPRVEADLNLYTDSLKIDTSKLNTLLNSDVILYKLPDNTIVQGDYDLTNTYTKEGLIVTSLFEYNKEIFFTVLDEQLMVLNHLLIDPTVIPEQASAWEIEFGSELAGIFPYLYAAPELGYILMNLF